MPKVKLANWFGENAPGSTVEVDESTASRLVDGGVGTVVEDAADSSATTAAPVAEDPPTSNWS